MTMWRRASDALGILLCSVIALSMYVQASGQPIPGGTCKLVSERTGYVGCLIIAHETVGQLTQPQTFWHLVTYPTPSAADAANWPRSTLVEAPGTTRAPTTAGGVTRSREAGSQ